jgi:hypothetical protein
VASNNYTAATNNLASLIVSPKKMLILSKTLLVRAKSPTPPREKMWGQLVGAGGLIPLNCIRIVTHLLFK